MESDPTMTHPAASDQDRIQNRKLREVKFTERRTRCHIPSGRKSIICPDVQNAWQRDARAAQLRGGPSLIREPPLTRSPRVRRSNAIASAKRSDGFLQCRSHDIPQRRSRAADELRKLMTIVEQSALRGAGVPACNGVRKACGHAQAGERGGVLGFG